MILVLMKTVVELQDKLMQVLIQLHYIIVMIVSKARAEMDLSFNYAPFNPKSSF
jgi:hypothetical protein